MATSVDTARALHARGIEVFSHGRVGPASTAFRRALRLLNDTSERGPDVTALAGRVWLSLALCDAERYGVDAATPTLDRAAAAAEASGVTALQVLIDAQRGSMLTRAGRLEESLAALDAALAAADLLEPRDQAVLLLNRGDVSLYRGELRAAERFLGRAVDIADGHGLAVQKLQAMHNLAYVRFLAGDLPDALRGMDDALDVLPDLGSGIPLLDRARVLVEAGLTSEADRTLSLAAEIFRRDRLVQDLGETELERARCALIGGDVIGARRLAGRARDRFRRRGDDSWRRAAELVLLQADLAAGRPGRRLVEPARRLHGEFVWAGLNQPARTARLVQAEALLAAGDVGAAADVLALERTSPRADPITARLHAHYVTARVDVARGRAGTAGRRIGRALRELSTYQASFGSLDLRTAAAVHGRRLAELDVQLALASARAAAVFAAAERARAVSSRLAPVRPPDDPAAADLLAELRQTIESLHAVQQDRAASAPLLQQRRALERQIVARTWTAAGDGSAVRAADLTEVRACLRDTGQTMVTYVQSGGGLWAVTLGDHLRLRELGSTAPVLELVRRVRADLDVLAQARLPAPLRGAIRASLGTSLAALDRALVAPLALSAGPVVVVSTGVLSQLPWGSLVSLRQVPLVVAPSATKWLRSATLRRRPGEPTTVAIAGPGLDRATDEAAAVATMWPGSRAFTADDATRVRFVEAMSSATILHVAAHGTHQPDNPLFSSLRLADGPVFAHELDRCGAAPEHVVLSACGVGLATVRPGDEALGLASVLLTLGTPCILAGVARVADHVAEATMAAYHARLAGGADSAAALADALADVDADVTPPFVAFGAAWTPSRRQVTV